jgi:hypothetical protein
VAQGFDTGALMARYYNLPRGPRVCLRLARPRDAAAIGNLYWANGLEPDDLELTRLVRFDPRERLVICATALVDSLETVVGVGAIPLEASEDPRPEFVLVDEHLTVGLEELLTEALVGRVRLLKGGRAA